MKERRLVSWVAVIGLLTACSSVTLLPEAMTVRVAHTPHELVGCTLLSEVSAPPPYVWPQDYIDKLRNATAGVGGNVVFVTSSILVPATGGAYRCPERKPST